MEATYLELEFELFLRTRDKIKYEGKKVIDMTDEELVKAIQLLDEESFKFIEED